MTGADIKSMLRRPVAFQPVLAHLCDNAAAGLMLSQALYWSDRTRDGWFYKTMQEWTEEVCLSRCEQEGARKILRVLGFWHEERRGVPAKLYFRLDLDKLALAVAQYAGNAQSSLRATRTQASDETANKSAQNQQSGLQEISKHKEQRLPETTTETTQRDRGARETCVGISPSLSGKRRFQLPQGFAPNEKHHKLAAELAVDLERSFAAFSDYHASKGNTFVDWDRALNSWLRNEQRFANESWKRGQHGNRAHRRQTDNIAAAEEAVAIIKRRMAV